METKRDLVTEFYQAQGKHDRQFKRLSTKPVCKWKTKDFVAIGATRVARDNAVAALSLKQRLTHVEKLSAEEIERRFSQAEARAAVEAAS